MLTYALYYYVMSGVCLDSLKVVGQSRWRGTSRFEVL